MRIIEARNRISSFLGIIKDKQHKKLRPFQIISLQNTVNTDVNDDFWKLHADLAEYLTLYPFNDCS